MAQEKQVRQVLEPMAEVGRKLWLATIGAVATVGEDAAQTFRTLVEKGRARDVGAGRPISRFVDELDRVTGDVQRKVQSKVEGGAQRTLHRLGLPTRDEIELLARRVEQLHGKLETLHTAKVN